MSQEMKSLVRGFVRWVILVGITLNVILWGFIISHCQTPEHDKLHPDQDSWEASVRITFITVTSKDKDLLYFYTSRKWEQRLASIGYDNKTVFQSVKDKKQKEVLQGCYLMFYCLEHKMALFLQQIHL